MGTPATVFLTFLTLFTSSVSRRSSFDQLEAASTLSPESTTKTADSGIESLANRLMEDQNLSSSVGSTPEPASSGNEQVDHALLWHLGYCERLLHVRNTKTYIYFSSLFANIYS